MVILGQHNVEPYVEKRLQKIRAFRRGEIVNIVEVTDYSNANFIFRVTLRTDAGRRVFFLKQAQRYNKRALRLGEKISVEPSRMLGEHRMLTLLRRLWGLAHVPEVIFFDRANHIIALSDVSVGKKLLVDEFAAGRTHPELGALFGTLFGRLHATTYGTRQEYAGSRQWKKQLFKILVRQYWGSGVQRYFSAHRVNEFLRQSSAATPSAIWGDPVYRNIFVNRQSLSCIDFDHASTADPAFDNGIFLAHWLWMAVKGSKALTYDAEQFIRQYVAAYRRALTAVNVPSEDITGIMRRTARWAGYYLISRTDGRSGSYFRQWPLWEQGVRQLGIDLFGERYRTAASRRLALLFTS